MAASNCEVDVQETEKKIEKASRLNPSDMQKIMELCTNASVNSTQVSQLLMTIVRKISEQFVINTVANEVQNELEMASLLAKKLRKHAKEHEALRYYYFGVYNARLDKLQADLVKQQSLGIRQEAAGRKNFKPIMSCVYKKGIVRQSELAKQLNMERGNLSREMTHLVTAGFIEQRKAGKYKLYNLSSMGEDYFKHFLVVSLPDVQAKDGVKDDIVKYFDYDEKPERGRACDLCIMYYTKPARPVKELTFLVKGRHAEGGGADSTDEEVVSTYE